MWSYATVSEKFQFFSLILSESYLGHKQIARDQIGSLTFG